MQLKGLPAVGAALPEAGVPARAAVAGKGVDFSRIVESLTAGTVDSIARSESVAARGLAGQASAHEVVQAVLDAEQKLAASIAVRDRIVAAYQDISRMAI